VTTDPFASVVVEGNTDLQPGANTLTVTVTAQNGDTSDVSVTLNVAEVSDDATLETLQVNGLDVADGDSVELPFGTRFVNLKVITTDINASYRVTGDGRKTPLVEVDQDLVVSVTAANGDTTDYTITLTVLPISENANLDADAGVTVNGESIDLELLNSSNFYSVPLSTKLVSIKAQAEDSAADVFVNNKTILPLQSRTFSVDEGLNTITIKVIPQAGVEFAKDYVLKIYVGGKDATLKLVKIGNATVSFNSSLEGGLSSPLANGVKTATLTIDPTVALATAGTLGTTIEFDGGDVTVTKSGSNTYAVAGLITGDNFITITVTPVDTNAEQLVYTVNIPVDMSSDAGLKTFKINGTAYAVNSTQIFDVGVTEVEIDAETNSEFATFEVEGGDSLVTGINKLTVTVTAEKGNTASYVVNLIIPKGKEVVVVGFPKVGVVKVDAKSNKAGNTVLTNLIKKLTAAKATVVKAQITNNFLIKKDKPAAGPARAKSVQTFLAAAKVTGLKTVTYELIAGSKTAKGTTVTIVWY
ncbi:MAG: cadherin-like beta sandwich domain-containing protein, partial [Rhodoluna sp.]